jgi:5-hydroxyisourate hydrolase
MSKISTHVLDAVVGKPAASVAVLLESKQRDAWIEVASNTTDPDGRCRELLSSAPEGIYRLTFYTGAYLRDKKRGSIYPEVTVLFYCDGATNYHLPLLLSDNSYTTYRGS